MKEARGPKTNADTEIANLSFSVAEIYLVFYNVFQFFGWVVILIQTLHHIISNGINIEGLWTETNVCLKIFQTLAVLEILHVIIGIVRSNVVTTSVQIFSRVFIVWSICNPVQASQMTIGIPLILIAWSVTEIIRYSFYFFNIMKMAPAILVYLRYTLFIGLYPMGVLGEQLCIYSALPYIARTKLFSITLPNAFNFTFDFYYFCLVVMFLYIPFFPQLYLHMFSQRRKILAKEAIVKTRKEQ